MCLVSQSDNQPVIDFWAIKVNQAILEAVFPLGVIKMLNKHFCMLEKIPQGFLI